MSGERLGDYQLLRYLNAGGMAELYLARHPRWGEPLVLKRLHSHHRTHPQIIAQFLDEGRIARRLAHRHVVRVLDAGQVDDAHYIAMEYIPGRDLGALLERGRERQNPLPLVLALGIIDQVASALAYIHELGHELGDTGGQPLGIVHRDLSPDNVMISRQGVAKLIDFGVARDAQAARPEDPGAGRPAYMAPERLRGQAVDARADLFSLGVILFELVVGQRPFTGSLPLVMHQICEAPRPRPRAMRPELPAALEALMLRLLERDADARPVSAAAVRAELRAITSLDERAVECGLAHQVEALFPRFEDREVEEAAVREGT